MVHRDEGPVVEKYFPVRDFSFIEKLAQEHGSHVNVSTMIGIPIDKPLRHFFYGHRVYT